MKNPEFIHNEIEKLNKEISRTNEYYYSFRAGWFKGVADRQHTEINDLKAQVKRLQNRLTECEQDVDQLESHRKINRI